MKTLNIGLVGYGFMGRTHSNAFLQAPRFFDLPRTPVLKAVAARNEARVKAFAEQLDCAGRITFTGLLAPPEVPARLAEADVLVLPNPRSAISNAFTSPLKLFEYMGSGRPIVASDLPSLREVLRDGENALLVEPGNPQALVAAIDRIKKDAALGGRLAGQALQDVQAFTWARRAEALEKLFATVAGARA